VFAPSLVVEPLVSKTKLRTGLPAGVSVATRLLVGL
jgi:hypothetical protein